MHKLIAFNKNALCSHSFSIPKCWQLREKKKIKTWNTLTCCSQYDFREYTNACMHCIHKWLQCEVLSMHGLRVHKHMRVYWCSDSKSIDLNSLLHWHHIGCIIKRYIKIIASQNRRAGFTNCNALFWINLLLFLSLSTDIKSMQIRWLAYSVVFFIHL